MVEAVKKLVRAKAWRIGAGRKWSVLVTEELQGFANYEIDQRFEVTYKEAIFGFSTARRRRGKEGE